MCYETLIIHTESIDMLLVRALNVNYPWRVLKSDFNDFADVDSLACFLDTNLVNPWLNHTASN